MISFQCDCGHVFKVRNEYAGSALRCPKCRATTKAPASGEVDPLILAVQGKAASKPGGVPVLWVIAGLLALILILLAVVLFGGFEVKGQIRPL